MNCQHMAKLISERNVDTQVAGKEMSLSGPLLCHLANNIELRQFKGQDVVRMFGAIYEGRDKRRGVSRISDGV